MHYSQQHTLEVVLVEDCPIPTAVKELATILYRYYLFKELSHRQLQLGSDIHDYTFLHCSDFSLCLNTTTTMPHVKVVWSGTSKTTTTVVIAFTSVVLPRVTYWKDELPMPLLILMP